MITIADKSDIKELRAYYSSLQISQRRTFIKNLQQKLNGVNSGKYAEFLSECIRDYNREIKTPKKEDRPGISSESFAVAFASMVSDIKPIAVGPRLVGTWQRDSDGKALYYKFNNDGTFETNTVPGHELLQGHYKIGMEDDILMEPHELLKVSSLMMTVSGQILTIFYSDGSAYDFHRHLQPG